MHPAIINAAVKNGNAGEWVYNWYAKDVITQLYAKVSLMSR